MNKFYLLAVVSALMLGTTFVHAQEPDEDLSITTDTETEFGEDDGQEEMEDEMDEEVDESDPDPDQDEDVVVNEDDDSDVDEEPLPVDEEITDNESEIIDTDSETIEGEVIEITAEVIVIENQAGEQFRIRRGGGSLLSPYVRGSVAGESTIKVGDMVEVEAARSVEIETVISEKPTPNTIVIFTPRGERQTLTPTTPGVVVRQNGQIVTDFSTLDEGEEIEIVFESDELILAEIADENSDNTNNNWVLPIIVLSIIIIGGSFLMRSKKRV